MVAGGGERLDVGGEQAQLEFPSAALSTVIPDDGWRASTLWGSLDSATGHQPRLRCRRPTALTGNAGELFTSILCLIY